MVEPVAPEIWTEARLRQLAGRALGRIDAQGPRGATLVSIEEIIAMAAMLAVFGLQSIPPGPHETT